MVLQQHRCRFTKLFCLTGSVLFQSTLFFRMDRCHHHTRTVELVTYACTVPTSPLLLRQNRNTSKSKTWARRQTTKSGTTTSSSKKHNAKGKRQKAKGIERTQHNKSQRHAIAKVPRVTELGVKHSKVSRRAGNRLRIGCRSVVVVLID